MSNIQLPIANGFYQSESLPVSAQQCVNWYPNVVQTQGLSQDKRIEVYTLKRASSTLLMVINFIA
jgi:hypothetical protein